MTRRANLRRRWRKKVDRVPRSNGPRVKPLPRTVSFLRILQMVHHETSTLVEDLKTYELPSTIPRSPVEGNESFKRFSTSGAVPATATAASISAMLETAMEELFVPYIEGQRYLEKESKSLSELYASFLTNFTRYHVCLRYPFYYSHAHAMKSPFSWNRVFILFF